MARRAGTTDCEARLPTAVLSYRPLSPGNQLHKLTNTRSAKQNSEVGDCVEPRAIQMKSCWSHQLLSLVLMFGFSCVALGSNVASESKAVLRASGKVQVNGTAG